MERQPLSDQEGGLFRPRTIEANPQTLSPIVGLFGTCGSPMSTWRKDIFIPVLEKKRLPYFNPQSEPNEWIPEMANVEAENLANDEVIVIPISKETHGYASMAEAGWAILGALLRGQKLSIFVQQDEAMPKDAKRARALFVALAERIQKEYPVFQFEETIQDQAIWAAFALRDRLAVRNSKIKETRKIELPTGIDTNNVVSILGTAIASSKWKEDMKKHFETEGINYFDSYKEDWRKEDIAKEAEHKLHDKVILQIITGETESFGSLAESGLLALSAFVRGQAYGLYIEAHPSDSRSDTNRARTLVKAHVRKLNEQFPGLVYLADSIEDLTRFAIEQNKK
jgi:hypothetical protein